MSPSFSRQIILWLRSHILSVMIIVLAIGGFSYASPYGGSIPAAQEIGKYQISCAGSLPAGSEKVTCIRMNTITGSTECKLVNNSSPWTAWGTCLTPW